MKNDFSFGFSLYLCYLCNSKLFFNHQTIWKKKTNWRWDCQKMRLES